MSDGPKEQRNRAATKKIATPEDRIATALERIADALERANLTNPLDVLAAAMSAAERLEQPDPAAVEDDQSWRFK